jgi:ubiquinone/menaquinone biosynthesis C-methylase UbiE
MNSPIQKNKQEYNAKAQAWEDAMQTNVGHKYLEKPAMDNELPENFSGKSILSIGVGSGDEFTEILKRNPVRVVGIDISDELLKIAARKYPSVEFKEMDMSAMDFPDASFDFIYSSLAFHYAPDWDVLLAEIGRILKPGGTLLFSTHNPEYWGLKPTTGNYTNPRGITLTEHTATLPADIEITFYNHQSHESIREALEYSGFVVQSFLVPSVIEAKTEGQEREWYEELKQINAEDPLFLVVKAVKK